MKNLKKCFQVVYRAEEWLGVCLLIALVGTVVLQIFFRYVVGKPLIWTEELSRFLFIWMIMLYAGHCVSAKLHIRVEVLVDFMPKGVQKALEIIMQLLGLVFFVYLIPSAWQLTIAQHRIISSALRFPYSFVYGSVVVGAILIIAHIVENLILTLFDKEVPEEV